VKSIRNLHVSINWVLVFSLPMDPEAYIMIVSSLKTDLDYKDHYLSQILDTPELKHSFHGYII
jgi:hypothetical protein